MFNALYGAPDVGLPSSGALNVDFWDEFRFWEAVLSSPVVPYGGITREFARFHYMPLQQLIFDHHIFTDASTSFGWGAVLNDHIIFGPWPDLSRVDSICWLELAAIRIALSRFGPTLAGCRVLVHTDSALALGVLNRGHSRHRSARLELMAIALLSILYGFEVRAVFVAGVDNPAGAPSRGMSTKVSFKDWTFRFFSDFCGRVPDIDCFADPSGYNSRCPRWFSHADPVQLHEADPVGRELWAKPPWSVIGQFLDTLIAAWSADPRSTSATIVLPVLPAAAWYRFYFVRPRRLFRTLRVYPAGSVLFFRADPQRRTFPHVLAEPCDVEVFVVRLGA